MMGVSFTEHLFGIFKRCWARRFVNLYCKKGPKLHLIYVSCGILKETVHENAGSFIVLIQGIFQPGDLIKNGLQLSFQI